MQAMQASKLSPVCVFGFLMGGGLMNTIEKRFVLKMFRESDLRHDYDQTD